MPDPNNNEVNTNVNASSDSAGTNETIPAPRPPEGIDKGEIPDILEWKLDTIMLQLKAIGGGLPKPKTPLESRPRLPDPKKYDPIKEGVIDYPGIPKVLETKLDVLMRDLAVIRKLFGGGQGQVPQVIPLANVNINLAPVIAVLWMILFVLVAINGALVVITGLLTTINATLASILLLVLFVVVQLVVPWIIRRNQARRQ